MLERCFGIRVPVEKLEPTRTLGEVFNVVVPLLPTVGSSYEERAAVEEKIGKVVMASYRRTKHEVVFNFACVQCGQRLGAEGLRLGKEHRSRFRKNFHDKHPGQLISVFYDIDAVCPRCACEYSYNSTECSLTVREGGT